jgi:SAM-dependent methyltransferase
MFSRSLKVGMTMDNPSDGLGHVIPGFPSAPTSIYNYHSSNYAFWGIHQSTVTPMSDRNPGSESTILRLTLYDVLRNQSKEIPLRFIELHGRPHVLYPAEAPPDWVRQATESPFVRWSVDGRQFIGTASSIKDPTSIRAEVLPPYATMFGRHRILQWFGAKVGCVTLTEAAGNIPYYGAVEAMFDHSAPNYDRVVRGNPFDLHLRSVALSRLRAMFSAGQRVLELGCGTGLETIPLAEAGVDMVAVDISSGMLDELDRKALSASVRDRIEIRKLAITDLSKIFEEFGSGSFDGVFSHFGALNCEPQLNGLPAVLHELVKPDGRVSLGIWNRTCISEMILYGIDLRPGRALARLQSSVPVGSSRFGVPVFPYSPGEVRRLFSPFFSAENAIGVSVVMPPYNLAKRLLSHPRLISLLEAGDRLVRERPFFRFLGDHFLLELRRR